MEEAQEHQLSEAELAQVEEMGARKSELISEIKKVIVGQDKVIEEILITLFCRGHCLLVGVPGLAKTLLISTLAGIMELHFNRVQFTPDLMPSDITGTLFSNLASAYDRRLCLEGGQTVGVWKGDCSMDRIVVAAGTKLVTPYIKTPRFHYTSRTGHSSLFLYESMIPRQRRHPAGTRILTIAFVSQARHGSMYRDLLT